MSLENHRASLLSELHEIVTDLVATVKQLNHDESWKERSVTLGHIRDAAHRVDLLNARLLAADAEIEDMRRVQ